MLHEALINPERVIFEKITRVGFITNLASVMWARC
jgi:hypothetical protein